MTSKVEQIKITLKPKFSLVQKALLLLATPFLVQLIFTLSYARLDERKELLARQEFNSKALLGSVNWLMVLLANATTAAFAYCLSKDTSYLQSGAILVRKIDEALFEFPISSTDHAQMTEARSFIKTVRALEQVISQYLRDSQRQGSPLSTERLTSRTTKTNWISLYEARSRLISYENKKLEVIKSDLPATQKWLKTALLSGALVDVLFGVGLVCFFHLKIGARINVLAKNADNLRSDKKLTSPQPNNDELGELDRVFHEMASELMAKKLELENSELRLKNLVENMPIGLVTIDQSGTITAINAETLKLLRLETSDLIGSQISSVFRGLMPNNLDDARFDFQPSKKMPTEIEFLGSNGKPLYLELLLKENQFRDESLTLVAIHDVSEQRENDRLKQMFFNTISHDLRGPLTAIQFSLHLLTTSTKYGLSVDAKNKVALAERNVARLVNLASDLLDLEKFGTGNLTITASATDSRSLVDSSVESIQALADEKTIKIVASSQNVHFVGDGKRLIQVLTNLLTNAIKFSSAGSTVLVRVFDKHPHILFEVEDSGRGVPKDSQKLIFEKFKQVMPQDANEKRGTGLGLPICKAIIEEHGGEIGVDSIVGKGSIFWFQLNKGVERSADDEIRTSHGEG